MRDLQAEEHECHHPNATEPDRLAQARYDLEPSLVQAAANYGDCILDKVEDDSSARGASFKGFGDVELMSW